jgi:hypothetical protein
LAQSNKTLARRKGNGPGHGGDARNYSWEPFQEGNTASLRHGLYATKFQMLEGKEEIAQTAELLRSILPTYASAFEPALQLLAARLWRLRRGYEFVERTPEGELPKHFLETLNSLEHVVNRSLAALGLTPIAASELGINLARLTAGAGEDEPVFNWNALEQKERPSLSVCSRRAGGPMATEREIREAERARLEGLVDEHGTESEQAALLLSGIKRAGVTLGSWPRLPSGKSRSAISRPSRNCSHGSAGVPSAERGCSYRRRRVRERRLTAAATAWSARSISRRRQGEGGPQVGRWLSPPQEGRADQAAGGAGRGSAGAD